MPERCSPARVRSAAPKTGAPLPAARRSGHEIHATGGSGGNRIGREVRFKEPDGLTAKEERGRLHKILDTSIGPDASSGRVYFLHACRTQSVLRKLNITYMDEILRDLKHACHLDVLALELLDLLLIVKINAFAGLFIR